MNWMDWIKLDRQPLVLKCGVYKLLATGTKSALADKLINFFRDSTSSDSERQATDDDDTVSLCYDSSGRDDDDYVPAIGACPGGPEEREEGEVMDDNVLDNVTGSSVNSTISTVAYATTALKLPLVLRRLLAPPLALPSPSQA